MSVTPPPSDATHRLARTIRVERAKGDPSVHVIIDGEPIPFFFTGEGVKVESPFGQPGRVTLTLTAEHIEVSDRYLEGAATEHALDHSHDDDVAECAEGCGGTPGHPGPCL